MTQDARYESEFISRPLRAAPAGRLSIGGAPVASWLFLVASLVSVTGTVYVIVMSVLTAGAFVLGE